MRELAVPGCRLIDLPVVHDRRGNLTFVEGGEHVPFDIGRAYWLYDVPGGESRAGHAHRRLEQLFVAGSGDAEPQLPRALRAGVRVARARQLFVRRRLPGARVAALRRGRLLPRLR